MKTGIRYPFALILLVAMPLFVHGQDECENALYDANSFYESGQIMEGIDRLEECLSSIRDKESQFEAYKLMGIMLHEVKDYETRDNYIEKMLRLRPEYLNFPNNDPSEFSKVVHTFRVVPDLYIGAELGGNYNLIRLRKSYSTLPYDQYYLYQPGYNIGLNGRARIKNDWSITLGLNYSLYGIEHVMEIPDKWNQTYSEQIRMIGLRPGLSKLKQAGNKTTVNAGLSLGLNYILSARASLYSEYLKDDIIERQTADVIDERTTFQPSLNLDLGLQQALPLGFLELKLSFDQFLSTTVSGDDRWNNKEFIYGTQYLSDDIKFSVIRVSFGYSIPIRYHIYR